MLIIRLAILLFTTQFEKNSWPRGLSLVKVINLSAHCFNGVPNC